MKIIKAVSNSKFEVVLAESANGSYSVGTKRGEAKANIITPIKDLSEALDMFDRKLLEMEGH